MKVIDLTHTIKENMPVYPGTDTPKFIPANSYEKDGFKETLLQMYTHTGTHMDPPDKRWGTDAYFGDYPCIDEEVLNFIISGNYKGIGFDVIGLDPIADENLTRHKKLFQKCDIVNIENLKNLELCGSDLFWFSCFPLKLDNCDGSPIRAVAWFE